MRRLAHFAVLLLTMTFIFPSAAFAYTYGDPNSEEVAETFKSIAAELGNTPIDWKKVASIHKVRRAEIASHFGNSVAVVLDKNIDSKNKDVVLSNYKAVLVMNLKRRFDYGKKDIADYSKAKLLLAKAKGTYDVLDTYVNAKKPDASSKIYKAFDTALEALGNPGLFGVGEKKADPKLFGEQVDFIYSSVKPLFPYNASAPAAAKPKPDGGQTGANKPQSPPAAGTNSKPPQPGAVKPAGTDSTGQKAAPATGKDSAVASVGEEEKKPDEAVKEEPADSTEKDNSTEQAATDDANSEEAVSDEQAAAPSEQPSAEQDSDEDRAAEAESAALEHAPMEHAEKTNSLVSIIIIGIVVLALGGAVWFAKKKKLF